MNFVIKASQLSVEKHITLPQKAGHAPSRCFVSLDLKNMFNEISWDKIFEVVEENFPKILPLPNFLYTNLDQGFFQDGKWGLAYPIDGGRCESRLPTLFHSCCYCPSRSPGPTGQDPQNVCRYESA